MLININDIVVRARVRSIKDSQVSALADSIAEIGLLNPVTITPDTNIRNGRSVDAYGLVAGAHRLEACKRLGMTEIETTVIELGEYERVIAECDENLCGTNLGCAERAVLTAERKLHYELLHPALRLEDVFQSEVWALKPA